MKKKEKEGRGVDTSSITPPSETLTEERENLTRSWQREKRKTLLEVLSLQTRERRVNFMCQFSKSAYLHGYIYIYI